MHRDYRIMVKQGNMPEEIQRPGWSCDIQSLLPKLEEVRKRYPHALVYLEVSPWKWNNDGTFECPGCEYMMCPSN